MYTHTGVHTQTDLLSHSSMLQFRLLLTIIAETVTGRGIISPTARKATRCLAALQKVKGLEFKERQNRNKV